MKIRIEVTRKNSLLYQGDYAAIDAKSFGDAFSDVWLKLVEAKLGAGTSVGAVYEALGDSTLPDLDGAQIAIKKTGR